MKKALAWMIIGPLVVVALPFVLVEQLGLAIARVLDWANDQLM